jgi:hypothetical protein
VSASEKFLRFAAECETMANLARDRESRLLLARLRQAMESERSISRIQIGESAH